MYFCILMFNSICTLFTAKGCAVVFDYNDACMSLQALTFFMWQ